MQYFPIIPHVDQQVERAVQQLMLRKNGETADMLKRMGMVYAKSYGASLVHIRQIAVGLERNNDVANRLWFRQIRETMILATMVADASTLSHGQLIGWAELISNAELTEQAAMNLYAHSPHLLLLINPFINSNNPHVRALALFALGWAIKFKNISVDDSLSSITRFVEDCSINHVVVGRGFSHVLRQLVRCGDLGLSFANDWMEHSSASDNMFVQVAVAEIAQEIEYVRNQ